MTLTALAPADEMPPPAAPLPVTPSVGRRATWELPALAAVLLATTLLYVWDLDRSGWANSFYSAAAQAGSKSWKAFFFGSSDAGNSITVDKPPAALWVSGLSVRLFGLNSWSILVPEALIGVATVGVVHAAVRRWFSAQAALLAASALALTPVAALMFRFNNPDALLVLLMSMAAYFTLRGIEDGRRRWALLTGIALGFGFLAKQMQVLLIVPPLALAYLVCAVGSFRRRIADLTLAGVAMVAAAGWWVVAVTLWPVASRPYIGGSQHNSILELTLGYNGLGRLTGDEVGSVGGRRPRGGGSWGRTGITRLFDGVSGGQIAWLIPAALIALAAVLWVTRRRRRTDITRAAAIVWGGWLVVTGLVFSYMQGIYHDYYTVALAPPVAALVAIGGHVLWLRRNHPAARFVLAATVVLTAVWSAALLRRAGDWHAWLRTLVVVAAVAAAALILGSRRRVFTAGLVAAVVAVLGGPAAWALATVDSPHRGAIVTAGPAISIGGLRGPFAGPPRMLPPNPVLQGTPPTAHSGNNGLPTRSRGVRLGGATFGGLLDSGRVSPEVVRALDEDAGRFRWVAATIGSNRAAGYQLASGQAIMPIGGFNGSDPSPTLAQFQTYVAAGKIHYYIGANALGPSLGGSQESARIAEWVAANFTPTEVDGLELYELTSP